MRFGRHQHRRIRDSVAEFCRRISGAGRNDHDVQKIIRPDRLRRTDGTDALISGNLADSVHIIFRTSEPRVTRLRIK